MLAHHRQALCVEFRAHQQFQELAVGGVAGGVASYGQFLKLLVGTELDAEGLPVVRGPVMSP